MECQSSAGHYYLTHTHTHEGILAGRKSLFTNSNNAKLQHNFTFKVTLISTDACEFINIEHVSEETRY